MMLRMLSCFGLAVVASCLFSSCATRALRDGEEQMLFTVETLREGGVLVPLPFEERHATSGRKRHLDGSLVLTYRFEPPESLNFPLYLESRAIFYHVPGEASYGQRALRFREFLAGIGEEDHGTMALPGLEETAEVSLVRDADGAVAAFLLTVRSGNALFLLALAGTPAEDPALWTGDIVRCVRALRKHTAARIAPAASRSSDLREPWLTFDANDTF